MKILILDLYKLCYRITGSHAFSVGFAFVYITILNLIVTYGIGVLMPGSAASKIIHILLSFPVCIATVIIMLLINFWIMTPLKNMKKERKNKVSYWGIVMYTCI